MLDALSAEAVGALSVTIAEADIFWTETLRLATRLANGPTRALARTRRLFWAAGDMSFEQQLDLEDAAQFGCGRDGEFREGVSAFLNKRPANFTQV